ncbi:hypothetical protein [Lactobacillus johnsonii]|uniref:Uncharacterized protein n=1 Tax=Lactobacillus johnsonii TaxID=33959 RepID=A0A9W4E983_LACJH|nr:hypothetical protein [Lactobacillus johnsonii]AZZ67186.1 hypothetical protein D7321_03320 [Lactobacillus johnsonii]
MAFYLDMSSVLDTFKTEVKVVSNSSNGEWVDGQWQETTSTQEQVFYEPFIPNDLVGQYSLMNMLRETGNVTEFNAIWLSSVPNFEIGTIVQHKDKNYKIVNIQDLSDYSNVTMYYLQSEEGNDGNKL